MNTELLNRINMNDVYVKSLLITQLMNKWNFSTSQQNCYPTIMI